MIEEASEWGDLLTSDTSKATTALTQWRAAASAEEKLSRTLREGGTAHQLSRAIQEAAAVGVPVEGARKMLKLVQGLEGAVAAVADGSSNPATLKSRIEAAEQGGCPPAVLAGPKQLLTKLLVAEARDSLETALKARAAQSSTQRTAALQTALAKAQAVLGDNEGGAHGGEEAALHGMCMTAQQQLEAAYKVCVCSISSVWRCFVEVFFGGVLGVARRELCHAGALQERERIEAERQEEQRLRRERLNKEREEREAQRAERCV